MPTAEPGLVSSMVAVPWPCRCQVGAAVMYPRVGDSHTLLLLGQAEVENLDLTLAAITAPTTNRFAGLMSRWMMPLACAAAKAAAACRAKGNHLVRGQTVSPGVCEILLQRHAAQQLHHQVGPPILLPGVVNRAHVGMVQRGRRTRFAQEAFMREVAAGVRCCLARRVVRLRSARRRGEPLPTSDDR